MMEWCCQIAKGRFENRNSYGEFLVAGRMGSVDQILFYSGFLMAHGDDLLGVIDAIRSASDVVGQAGISNFKLSAIGCVQFCSHCGVRLKDHYGSEGGALRDDDFVKQMREFA